MKKDDQTPSLFDALPDPPREEPRVTGEQATSPAVSPVKHRKAKAKQKENLADQAARDCIRNDLDTSLVVEAAAGTGGAVFCCPALPEPARPANSFVASSRLSNQAELRSIK